jgi:predicted porin
LAEVAPNLKAVYQLEGGLFVNNGRQAQSGRLFGRQAYAGVTGRLGTVTFGRQYTPMLNTVATFDSFGQGYGSPANDGQVSFGLDARYDSALIYATPDLGGFSASVMLVPGGKQGQSGKGAAGFNAGYTAGPLEVGLAYQQDDHHLAGASKVANTFAGAAYKLGAVKLMGGIGQVRSTPDAGASSRRSEWLIGSQIDVTSSGQLWLDYGVGKTQDSAPSDTSQALSAAWVQSLAKQARVYLVASTHKNGPAAALTPVGTSSSGGYSVSPGNTARALAVGFQYDF